MNEKQKMTLADMIINAMRNAEHERVVVRFYDKTKLSDKEIQRRSNNTLSGIGRSYSKDAVCDGYAMPDCQMSVYYALKEGVKFEDTLPPNATIINDKEG